MQANAIPINDFMGQPMRVGQIIVYGHALGRCAALKVGKIMKLSAEKKPAYYQNGEDRIEYRITVQGVEYVHTYDQATDTHGMKWELCRKGILQFPDRCKVVHDHEVPAEIKTLLDEVKV
jgi:hypothetical protein